MSVIVGILLFIIFPCLIISTIYYTIKMKKIREQNVNSYNNDPLYEQMKRKRKIILYVLPAVFIVGLLLAAAHGYELEKQEKENIIAKAESYTGGDKEFYETKFAEFRKDMNDEDARKQAVAYTEKSIEFKKQINGLNDEDKILFEERFAQYKEKSDAFSAISKALKDVDNEKKKREEAEEQKRKELQKNFDDQAKYEEWLAWQKSEEEKKAAAELQKKYDDQAKYEEWIAWQKSEEQKKAAVEEAERNKYSTVYVEDMYRIFKDNPAKFSQTFFSQNVRIVGGLVSAIDSGGGEIKVNIKVDEWGTGYYDWPLNFGIWCKPKDKHAPSDIFNMHINQNIIIYGRVTGVGNGGCSVLVDKFEY